MSEATLSWTPHPVLKIPTREQCLTRGEEWTFEVWRKREELIALELHDPYRHGYLPYTWEDAMALLEALLCLVVFGGNGSAKTWFGAWVGLKTMMENPGCMVLWLHESEPSSIRIQQKAVYHYLPVEVRPTDEHKLKRGVTTKVKYSIATGFSDNTFVLPNGSMGVFGSYKQDIGDYEGDAWKLVVADENLPLAWMNTLMYRLPRRGGRLIWTFTPIRGITPAIKQVMTGAKTERSQRAELLGENHRIDDKQDWPLGHVPYVQRSVYPKTALMFWPTKANPWSGYDDFRLLMQTKASEEIERRAYGYARNMGTTMFPKFSAVHIVEPDEIPSSDCTHYVVFDPHLDRNWFFTWIDVDKDGRHYVVDEWPDYETYGEWAVPSEHPNRFNGDPGPAQTRLGWGIVEYKRLLMLKQGYYWDDSDKTYKPLGKLRRSERRHIERNDEAEYELHVLEEIFSDPRAGAAEGVADEEGESSIIFRFSEDQLDRDGNVIGPGMDVTAAAGKDEREGVEKITDLMSYNLGEKVTKLVNEPRLYVSSKCRQTICAFQNYSKRPGQGQTKDEACKDPIDNLRYATLADLEWLPPRKGMQMVARGYGNKGGQTRGGARVRTYKR